MPKIAHIGEFWKPEACGQTVLPDRSLLIGQKLVENAKVKKFKCDILSDFQTLCHPLKVHIVKVHDKSITFFFISLPL